MRRLADTNLYVMTAGETVQNPLELLNLKECKALIQGLRSHFDWVILDSPPLLFAADGNLLATMCDGTILVVRIGTTTFDSVTRALQSLCENNVLGVVVNGARRGELYSKYTYYHNYYYAPETEEQPALEVPEGEEVGVQAERSKSPHLASKSAPAAFKTGKSLTSGGEFFGGRFGTDRPSPALTDQARPVDSLPRFMF